MNNPPDPTLTSWALNELDHDERAAFEAEMKNNPTVFAEAQMTQNFCRFIQSHVRDDNAALTDSQRTRLSSYVSWRPKFDLDEALAPTRAVKQPKPRWYQQPSFILGFSAAAAIALGMWPYWSERLFPTPSVADYIPFPDAAAVDRQEMKHGVLAPSIVREDAPPADGRQRPSIFPAKLVADAAVKLQSAPSSGININLGTFADASGRNGTTGGRPAASYAAPSGNVTTLTISGGATITFGNAAPGQSSTPVAIDIQSGTVSVSTRPNIPARTGGGSVNELEDIITRQTTASGGTLSSESVRNAMGADGVPQPSDASAASALGGLSFVRSAAFNVRRTLRSEGNFLPSALEAQPVSTQAQFPFTADPAAYARVKRALDEGRRPAREIVRMDGMINAPSYDYDFGPAGASPLAASAATAEAPWNPAHRLVRIAVRSLEDLRDVSARIEFNPALVRAGRLIGGGAFAGARDLNNSSGASGDLSAGRTITALYEIIPAGGPGAAGVLMNVKFTCSKPGGGTAAVINLPVNDQGTQLRESDRDFKQAAAVAAFGLMLDDASGQTAMTWPQVRALAESANARDRGELVRLIDLARGIVGDGAR